MRPWETDQRCKTSAAVHGRSSLAESNSRFGAIESKIETLIEKYPIINNLISRIRAYENRDAMVMACVIASCMFFTFFYLVTKH